MVEPADRGAARPLDQDGPEPRLECLHEDPGRRSGAGDRQGPGGRHRRPLSSAAPVAIDVRTRASVVPQAPWRLTVGILAAGTTLLLLAAALTLLVAAEDVPGAGHLGSVHQLIRLATLTPLL